MVFRSQRRQQEASEVTLSLVVNQTQEQIDQRLVAEQNPAYAEAQVSYDPTAETICLADTIAAIDIDKRRQQEPDLDAYIRDVFSGKSPEEVKEIGALMVMAARDYDRLTVQAPDNSEESIVAPLLESAIEQYGVTLTSFEVEPLQEEPDVEEEARIIEAQMAAAEEQRLAEIAAEQKHAEELRRAEQAELERQAEEQRAEQSRIEEEARAIEAQKRLEEDELVQQAKALLSLAEEQERIRDEEMRKVAEAAERERQEALAAERAREAERARQVALQEARNSVLEATKALTTIESQLEAEKIEREALHEEQIRNAEAQIAAAQANLEVLKERQLAESTVSAEKNAEYLAAARKMVAKELIRVKELVAIEVAARQAQSGKNADNAEAESVPESIPTAIPKVASSVTKAWMAAPDGRLIERGSA